MKQLTKMAAVGGSTALAATLLVAGLTALPAQAASTPPVSDPSSLGTVTLYDASGSTVSSGKLTDSPIVAYAAASSTFDGSSDTKAQLYVATPTSSTPDLWPQQALTRNTVSPPATGPSVVTSATTPVATGASGDTALTSAVTAFPNTTSGATAGLYQLRLISANSGNAAPTAEYWTTWISVDTAAGTWTQVFPVPNPTSSSPSTSSSAPATKDDTSTTLTAPATGGNASTTASLTLTAHVTDVTSASSVPTGTVAFADGGSPIGAAVALDGSGNASLTVPGNTLGIGSHSFTAAFSATGNFTSSATSSATSFTITLPTPGVVLAPAVVRATVGVTAACNPGLWTYAGAYAVTWRLDGVQVATAPMPVVPAAWYGHSLVCRVTASNPSGTTVSDSTAVKVAPGAAPHYTTRPKIVGTPSVGRTISAYRGIWVSPAPTSYQYVWLSGTTVLSRSTSLKLSSSLRGKTIVLRVVALRPGYRPGVANSLGVKVG